MINPAQKKNMKRPRSECANLDFLRDDFDVGNDYDPGRFQIAKDVEEAANGFEVITCVGVKLLVVFGSFSIKSCRAVLVVI